VQIKLTRTGGFAGITPLPVEVDTASLPKQQAQQVESLVAKSNFFQLPENISAKNPQSDRFQYTLHIAHEDGREHTLTCDEEAASDELRELLYAVQNLKRK
jgi:hypothetical protein